MIKYDTGLSISSDENGGNAIVKVNYFGIAGKERIDVEFGEFHGSTVGEATKKAHKAVNDWILKK